MTARLGFRDFPQTPQEGIVSVHDPIAPAEVYAGQPITVAIRRSGTDTFSAPIPVYRLSPLGVEIDVTQLGTDTFSCGSEVDLRVDIARQICSFFGVTVATNFEDHGKKLIGIRLCQEPAEQSKELEKRKLTRWLCGEHFLPTGMAPNPARFNDFIYFSVVDISRGGMQLATSLRNKFLIPGMVLESSISFPMVGQITLHLKITNARIRSSRGKDFLALGTEVLEHDQVTLETLGQYLLQFGPPLTVGQLKQEGFAVRSTASAVSYAYVRTVDEYREVLQLRKLAYSQVGKFDSDQPEEQMSDIFDAKSRILLAKHGNEPVGSLRITFHSPDEANEYDQYVTLPENNFPRRDELVVLSRICTNPAYRGSDLFYGIMRQCVLAVLQSRRRYILGGCQDSLLPLYQKVGFKPTGIFFEHGGLNKNREQIILADVLGMLSGADVSLAIWNELYADLTSYLSQQHDIPFDPAMNLRLGIYRTFGPLTRAFTRGVRHPKKRA